MERCIGRERQIPAEKQQRGGEHLTVELQQRQELARHLLRPHVIVGVVGHQIGKERRVHILSHESLRHPNTAHRFRQRCRHPTEAFLHIAPCLAQPPAEIPYDHVNHRGDRQHQTEQQPVVPQHHRPGDHHLTELHDRHEKHILHAGAHRFHVRVDARDDPAAFRAVEVPHRQRLQMFKQPIA